MNRLPARLCQIQRHTWAFIALAAIPALGLLVNTTWPPDNYAYSTEQFFLCLLALGALWVSRATVTGAVFLYSCLALLPVGAMLEYYTWLDGGFSVLELTPLAGIVLVAWLARDERATLLYGGIAIITSSVLTGVIRGDVGQAGALSFLCGLLTPYLYYRLCCDRERDDRIERVIHDTGELGAMVSEINSFRQELFDHDP